MSTAATNYAAALQESGCTPDSLRETAAYLTGNRSLWEALLSPAIEPREKQAVLRRLPDFTDDKALLRFYALLAERNRLSLLPEIVEQYESLERNKHGEGLCIVRCARDPGDEALGALAKLLCKRHGYQTLTFEIVIDPEVLGGFTFEIDGVTYDKSVRGQLRALAQSLQEG